MLTRNHAPKTLRALDLNLLPILRELLYTQNVSKAAQRLHMSQSAVSEALGRLRVQYNDEILIRVGRKMVPTPLAKSLISPLDDILGQIESLSVLHQGLSCKDIKQNLVIATGDSIIVALGKSLIAHLSQDLPGVNLQFIDLQNFDVTQLKSGEIDFAIMPKSFLDTDDICSLPLFREDFVIISRQGHPVMRSDISQEELGSIAKLGYQAHPDSPLRVPPPPGWQEQILIAQMGLLPYLVERSDSIALIQRHVAQHFREFMNIEIYEIRNFSWKADVSIFWGKINRHSLLHSLLADQLREMLDPTAGYEILPIQ